MPISDESGRKKMLILSHIEDKICNHFVKFERDAGKVGKGRSAFHVHRLKSFKKPTMSASQ